MTERKTKEKFLTIERMSLIAVLSALMCVCSWISIPSPFNPSVPFTLQTLAIILSGLLLSPLEALFSSLVYLMLGIVGLPVFAGFSTLYAKIATATGGYIIGFFITPFIIAGVRTFLINAADKHEMSDAKKKTVHTIIYIAVAVVIGILGVDIPGVIQFKLVTHSDWGTSVVLGALSFMPTDLLKCIAAGLLAVSLEKPLQMIRSRKTI